jgi:hypothetical protein
MTDFKEVERIFERLLRDVGKEFSPAEISEVREYIDHAEYGLALETLLDICREEGKPLKPSAVDLIGHLAGLMQMNRDELFKRLG